MSIDLTIGSIGDIALKSARQQKTDSIKNLASGKQQVVLIALHKPMLWMQNHQEQLKAVTAAKIPIVVC